VIFVYKRVAVGRGDAGAEYLGLIICGALFICGGIVGVTAAGLASSGAGVSDYLTEFLVLASGAPVRLGGFLRALFNDSAYHLAVIFLGFSAFGVFLVPALSAVRGFFLCFSVSAVVRHFGGDGVLLTIAIFGVGALMTVPCLFILSVQSFSSSLYVLKSVAAKSGVAQTYRGRGGYFRRVAICAAVLMTSALIDTLLIPRLIDYAAGRIM